VLGNVQLEAGGEDKRRSRGLDDARKS
jgi:hypothetical protein